MCECVVYGWCMCEYVVQMYGVCVSLWCMCECVVYVRVCGICVSVWCMCVVYVCVVFVLCVWCGVWCDVS